MILNNQNHKYAQKLLHQVVDSGIDFKLHKEFKQHNMSGYNWEDSSIFEFPYIGSDLPDLILLFEKEVLPYCTNFSSETFMGFPDSGNSIAGIAGAIMSDLLQQNLINASFCAPIGTFIEMAVIQWLRNIVGYKPSIIDDMSDISDVGGIITYGGTGSNSIAMLLARENYMSGTMSNGVVDPSHCHVILPKGIGHYSIKSSLMWIGCGDHTIEVPTISFRYNLLELERTLLKNKGKVMSVVAYVGDSRSMTIDHLKEVAELVKGIDPKIWLHADACHGFSLGFSEKLRSKIQGIELFDSISTDPHKVLMLPYTISALLLRDPQTIKKIMTTSDLIMSEPYAFGQVTPFIGSKSWISLKLWFALKNFGIKGVGEIIEKRCENAQYLKRKLIKSKEFIVLNDVDINSVMFMYVKDKHNISCPIDNINLLNQKIKQKIDDDGRYYLHQFPINDNNMVLGNNILVYPLRYMSGNPNLSHTDINAMVDYVMSVAKHIDAD